MDILKYFIYEVSGYHGLHLLLFVECFYWIWPFPGAASLSFNSQAYHTNCTCLYQK